MTEPRCDAAHPAEVPMRRWYGACALALVAALAGCRSESAPSPAEGGSGAAATATSEGSGEAATPGDEQAAPTPDEPAAQQQGPAFEPAEQLVGTWVYDEDRTRAGLSAEIAAQLPPGLDARMVFGAPEGSGDGAFSMHWLIPGEARTEPDPGTWSITDVDPESRRVRVQANVIRTDQGGISDMVDADITLPPDGTLHFVDRDFPGLVMVWKWVPSP